MSYASSLMFPVLASEKLIIVVFENVLLLLVLASANENSVAKTIMLQILEQRMAPAVFRCVAAGNFAGVEEGGTQARASIAKLAAEVTITKRERDPIADRHIEEVAG